MEIVLLLLAVLAFALTIVADIATDVQRFGTPLIVHYRGALLRLPGLALSSGLLAGFSRENWPICFAVLAFAYWLLFDYALNVAKGFYWLRIGQTAMLDKFLQNFGPVGAFIFKATLFVLSLAAAYFINA